MPCRRNEAAAVEITALAAGAGPPANKMATRRIARRRWRRFRRGLRRRWHVVDSLFSIKDEG